MAEPPELVIFDCDGVLVDSETIAVPIDAAILEQYGIRITEAEIIDRFVGRSPSVMTEFIEAHLGHGLPEGAHERFEEMYAEAFRARLVPVDGIEEVLDRLALATCVASSSEPEPLRVKLELTGLYERFAGHLFSAAEVDQGKPAPDLFLHAANRMGVDPARCAVVEDSQYGVQAARAAGMNAFGYAGGLTAAVALAGPATTVFDDMRQLPGLLGVQPLPSR